MLMSSPPLSQGLATACSALSPALKEYRGAWATWRRSAENARLAAVMGSVVQPYMRQSNWDESLSLTSDSAYQDCLIRVSELDIDAADALDQAVQDHISWLMRELESGAVARLEALVRPSSDGVVELAGSATAKAALADAKAETKRLESDLKAHIETIEREVKDLEFRLSDGMSKTRQQVIDLHAHQTRYEDGDNHRAKQSRSDVKGMFDSLRRKRKSTLSSLPKKRNGHRN